MSHIKFITDSAADIPRQVQAELGIEVLPFHIAMRAEEIRDGVDYPADVFYQKLMEEEKIPTHSQITSITFAERYEAALAEGYTDVIYVSINAKASATYQNALLAIEEFHEEHPEAVEAFHIHVVDSANYTIAYGYPVMEAARMAKAGADAEEVLAYLRGILPRMRVIFAPYDLSFAKKSGRINVLTAWVGEALGLRPVMTFLDGETKILTKVRGDRNVVPEIVKLVGARRDPATPYICVTGALPERNAELEQASREAFGEAPLFSNPIGGVIAINAGPNLVCLAYCEKE